MPLLRITCPPPLTERFIDLLLGPAEATEISVHPRTSRVSGGDVIQADVPRHVVDGVLTELRTLSDDLEGLHISIEPSERLFPRGPADERDNESVVWAQVAQEVHELGRLSWINQLLLVAAAMIAALGILEDQLLLIVGAMALSPDYYPIALTCLGVVDRDWKVARRGLGTIAVLFVVGIFGALALTWVLVQLGLVSASKAPSQQLTQFISRPDALSVVVAVIAGIAGAIAITLPDARGIVGVFVSVTTIPAAADIGVAIVAHDGARLSGAAVQLGVNVASLLLAGAVTLAVRRAFPEQLGPGRGRERRQRHMWGRASPLR